MILHKKRKVLETICIICGPISMGIYLELVGPAMKDFRRNVSANYEEIARALVARSVGYFIGSVVSGFLCDKYVHKMELFLSVAYLFGTIGTAAAPWCQSLAVLALFFHLQGMGQGAIDVCNNTLIAKIWKAKAAAPLTALHFAFGIGALSSPFIARPFLKETTRNSSEGNTTEAEMYNDTLEGSVSIINGSLLGGYDSNLVPPYSFSATLTLIFCIVFLIFYLSSIKKDRAYDVSNKNYKIVNNHERRETTSLREILSPGSCVGGNTLYGLQMFGLILFYFLNIVGGERAYGKFLFSYATDSDVQFDNTKAAMLNAIFWLCFTIGRGAAILPAHFIAPHIVLFVELAANVLVTVILAIWAYNVPNILWVFSGAMGLVLSPVFPGGLAWINLYVNLRGMAMAVIFLGAALGGMVYQYLTGYMFEYYGPRTLMYIMVGYAVLSTTCYLCMFGIGRAHGQQRNINEKIGDHDKDDEQVENISI